MTDSEEHEINEAAQGDLTDWQYVVMISLLRINDALGALLQEIRNGAGQELYDIHNAGEIIMPEPKLNGEFGTGFGPGKASE